MPRRAKPRRNRDGVTIEDLWSMRGRQTGAHWRYRVRDTLAGRYRSAVFHDHPEADVDRRHPGCTAGDKWAKDTGSRFTLGQDTAHRADLEFVASAYLQELKEAKAHETTRRNVELAVEGLKAAKATDLSAKDFRKRVAKWLSELKPSRSKAGTGEAAGSTRLRYLSHTRALVNYARTRGWLGPDPLHKLKIAEAPADAAREVFTLDELRRLAARNDRKNPRWLWIMLMLFTGQRREEAAASEWQRIDWQARILPVDKGKGRRGGKRRTIYLMDEAYDLLSTIGGPDAQTARVGRIVPSETKSGITWAQFRNVLLAAGIEPERGIDRITGMPRRLSPHSCRHSFAALYLATGGDSMDLRRMLGHSADDLTEYYSQQVDLYRRQVQAEGWERGQFYIMRPPPKQPAKVAK